MTGFMALAPWLGTHLAPVITPVFSAVGCDPSLFASLFLSCDAGGAVLAAQIAQEPAAGLYNGLIVAAFLGSTINGTIPLALGQLTGTKRAAAVRGLFLGFLVLPVGCLLTGALCGPGRLRSIQYYKTAPLPVRCKISAAGASCV